jgi:hypothetical protein
MPVVVRIDPGINTTRFGIQGLGFRLGFRLGSLRTTTGINATQFCVRLSLYLDSTVLTTILTTLACYIYFTLILYYYNLLLAFYYPYYTCLLHYFILYYCTLLLHFTPVLYYCTVLLHFTTVLTTLACYITLLYYCTLLLYLYFTAVVQFYYAPRGLTPCVCCFYSRSLSLLL